MKARFWLLAKNKFQIIIIDKIIDKNGKRYEKSLLIE